MSTSSGHGAVGSVDSTAVVQLRLMREVGDNVGWPKAVPQARRAATAKVPVEGRMAYFFDGCNSILGTWPRVPVGQRTPCQLS